MSGPSALSEISRNAAPSADLLEDLSFATISSMYRKAFVLLGTLHDVIGEVCKDVLVFHVTYTLPRSET